MGREFMSKNKVFFEGQSPRQVQQTIKEIINQIKQEREQKPASESEEIKDNSSHFYEMDIKKENI